MTNHAVTGGQSTSAGAEHALSGVRARALIVVGWLAAVSATQAWLPWKAGIKDLFATNVISYAEIARAAPHLPHDRMQAPLAQRFITHWLVGDVYRLTGANLHELYRAACIIVLLAILLVLERLLVAMGLGRPAYAICIGLVVASAYPVRFLLAAPGMLADGVLMLGLALAMLGLLAGGDGLVVGGVLVAAVGRQTALPFAAALAVVLLLRRGRQGVAVAVLSLTAAIATYAAEWAIARPFSTPERGGARAFTILGLLGRNLHVALHDLVSADARAFLGVLVPLGVVAGCWLRGVRPAGVLSLLAFSVFGQTFVLLVGNNTTRLGALAMPPLVVVAADQLRRLELGARAAVLVSACTLVGSFHSRYSNVGVPSSGGWVVLEAVAAIVIALVLAGGRVGRVAVRRSVRDGPPAVEGPAP